jgi:hypothetical protein
MFEVERDDTAGQWLRAGAVEEVKTPGPKGSGPKASGGSARRGRLGGTGKPGA